MHDVLPTFDDVVEAARRIDASVVHTPVVRNSTLDERVGAQVWLKCENLQEAGAFKFRGATNAVLSLPDDQAVKGVAAHSSGNHAAALALAARRRGIPAYVVMPHNAPRSKVDAVRAFGGHLELCAPTLAARETTLRHVLDATGATEIHPYDDPRVIAGAGTAAFELMRSVTDLDLVVAPVSGGGLLSGTCVAVHGTRPSTSVWGAEPAGVDDAYQSLRTGIRQGETGATSIADGLLAVLSDRTFTILRAHVDEIVRVDEKDIVEAMHFSFDHVKLVVEPSAAVALAALFSKAGRLPPRVGVVVSGGNVDRHLLVG